MREKPRRRWHERGVRGSRAGIARCSRGRCSSQKRSVARWSRRGDSGGTHQAAIVHFFKENTVYRDLLSTISVPKAEELVATPYRHGTKKKAEKFFLDGMTQAMHNLAVQAHPAAPITIYYAFKQSETESRKAPTAPAGKPFLKRCLKSVWRSLALGQCERSEQPAVAESASTPSLRPSSSSAGRGRRPRARSRGGSSSACSTRRCRWPWTP